MTRLLFAVLAATVLLFACIVAQAAPADGGFDASMSLAVPPSTATIAPASSAAPAADPPLTRSDVSALVAFGVTALAFYLRKWSPPGHWNHSTQALALVSGVAAVLTVVAGVIAEHGLSKRAIITSVIAYGMSAMAQANASSAAAVHANAVRTALVIAPELPPTPTKPDPDAKS